MQKKPQRNRAISITNFLSKQNQEDSQKNDINCQQKSNIPIIEKNIKEWLDKISQKIKEDQIKIFEEISFDLSIFQMQLLNQYRKTLKINIHASEFQLNDDFKQGKFKLTKVIKLSVKCLKKQIEKRLIDFDQVSQQQEQIVQLKATQNLKTIKQLEGMQQNQKQNQSLFPQKIRVDIKRLRKIDEELERNIQRNSAICQFFSIQNKKKSKTLVRTKFKETTSEKKEIFQFSKKIEQQKEQIAKLKQQVEKLKKTKQNILIDCQNEEKLQEKNEKSNFLLWQPNRHTTYLSCIRENRNSHSYHSKLKLSQLLENKDSSQCNSFTKSKLPINQKKPQMSPIKQQQYQQRPDSELKKYLKANSKGEKPNEQVILRFYKQKYKFDNKVKNKVR